MAWSYSSIKTFEQCPKKYYHLRVAKDYADTGGAAAKYGEEAHKAAEEYVRDGAPMPPKFKFMEPVVQTLSAVNGDKHTEIKLGVRKLPDGDYEPCDFFASDVWWRGIADLLILDGERALLVDYKTGKSARYADTKQLDLMAGAVFVKHPEVTRIKSALAFVVSGELVTKNHTRELTHSYLNVFEPQLERLAVAHANDVWNPRSSGLCGYCPVESCIYHRG